jgi:glycosyltransferase involved in cell wall biosynthesis
MEAHMKVAFITRSTLFTVPGGDTVQITSLAKHLEALGIGASIQLTHEPINYAAYDLLHFFNITRPADILYHLHRTPKPYVISPNLVNYSEYETKSRKGFAGTVLPFLKPDTMEYIKTIARWINGSDRLNSHSYLWKGQKKCIRDILNSTSMVLPNSSMENIMIGKLYGVTPDFSIIPNGIDSSIFMGDDTVEKDEHMVLCVARIEGIKNQFKLIKALNNTKFSVFIVGSPAYNHRSYFQLCKKSAAPNICFVDHLTQTELVQYYKKAKVHILPSWFETCGLSTLEAAVMGCTVVVTDKGYTREYFEDYALYCDPASHHSILEAVQKASIQAQDDALRNKILSNYTWQLAASRTAEAYQKTMQSTWD